MKDTATHLTDTINKAYPLLAAISNEEASVKPAPGKWSYKEIIGHLIDSAANNHQKFVRTIAIEDLSMVGYTQDDWVSIQQYNETSWEALLELWKAYNLHLAQIMAHTSGHVLDHRITIDGKGPFTLEFIMSDYAEHLKHHLKAILPGATFLENKFRMVY